MLWNNNNNNTNNSETLHFSEMKETLINDAHLNRLLMIEIINNKNKAEVITFEKMNENISLITKTLLTSFGPTITNKIITLFQRRNEILKDYYSSMKNIICDNNSCVQINKNDDDEMSASDLYGLELKIQEFKGQEFKGQEFKGQEFKGQEFRSQEFRSQEFKGQEFKGQEFRNNNFDTLDITTITNRKLEAIAREITDSIATSFNIRDVDQTFSKRRPTQHYQRLYNLIVMYDKELLNQAKSYVSNNYKISMECNRSSIEIISHLYDELTILIKKNNLVTVK